MALLSFPTSSIFSSITLSLSAPSIFHFSPAFHPPPRSRYQSDHGQDEGVWTYSQAELRGQVGISHQEGNQRTGQDVCAGWEISTELYHRSGVH